jgi:hypothetical protein
VVGATEGSANTRRVDPLADLREAREEREEAERQEAEAAKAQADAAARIRVDAAAKAQAEAAAKAQAKESARGRTPQLVILLRAAPPTPEIPRPTGGAGDDQPVMERGEGDAIISGAEAPPRAPTAGARSNRPDVPPVPQVSSELAVGATPMVRPSASRRVAKAASAPWAQEIGAASSSAPDAEATSAAPPEWTPGGGTGVLNKAAQDVQAQLQAQSAALQQCTKAFLAT